MPCRRIVGAPTTRRSSSPCERPKPRVDLGGPSGYENFTNPVVAATEAAGPYRCRTQSWGLHNYAIEAIEKEVEPGRWVRVADFDGDELAPWGSLPEPVRDALVAHNDGEPPAWHL